MRLKVPDCMAPAQPDAELTRPSSSERDQASGCDRVIGAHTENCTNPDTCSALDYTGSTEIYQGAQFVVSQLVG
jgi:hypothetical protein